jgi:hypothetical protein
MAVRLMIPRRKVVLPRTRGHLRRRVRDIRRPVAVPVRLAIREGMMR